MRVLLISLIVALLAINIVESEAAWQKEKKGWHKYSGGKYTYHKYEDHDNPPPPPLRKVVPDNPEEAFQNLAKELIAEDQLHSQYCEKNTVKGVTEVYGLNSYKLILPFDNNDPEAVVIKIKHRALHVTVEEPEIDSRWQSDSDTRFDYIATLSSILNPAGATWDVRNRKLEISIPYKVELINTEVPKTCNNNANLEEVTVQRAELASRVSESSNAMDIPNKEEGTKIPDIDKRLVDRLFGSITLR